MPAIARGKSTDTVSTGHSCTSSTTTDKCSGNVYVNNKGVCRKGDKILPHTTKVGNGCVMHDASINAGSGNVFANGIAISRKGDSADAGSISSGSSNVFAN